jgi:carnitine 3-dehydrogenase
MKAAIIGGGVIGGGWAARFLLNGWDVDIFDLDPEAERKIGEVLSNARQALPHLYDKALPNEGKLSFKNSIATCVENADWVQESVPERLDLKLKVHEEINNFAPKTAFIGSSTSGFKPSEINQNGTRAFVAHPFNPVYLLPLVELVGAPQDSGLILESIGMFALNIRKEIDAHIADRLLEAVWREALWLVKDGIATTEEIDESIRMGFGLRWAQMGLFETYRIAGGEAGMKHFMAQFGPCLSLPWTKLMDVPEFDDALVNLIAEQSDAQSGSLSIRELERQRDSNLIGFMRHLKAQNWGAGKVIAQHEQKLHAKIGSIENKKITTGKGRVLPSWIDYNGHMTEYRYGQILADGVDELLIMAGLDLSDLSQGGSYFTVENHVNYLSEMKLGEEYHIEARIMAFDDKRLHVYQRVYTENGSCAASGEHMLLYVDAKTRKVGGAPKQIMEALNQFAAYHANIDIPNDAGKVGK